MMAHISKILWLEPKPSFEMMALIFSLWSDIIVWFPGETEEHFMETYNFISQLWIQKLHAFPFSGHEMGESVPASNFKNQIDARVKKQRMQKITQLWESIRDNFIKSQKGKTLQVLIEQVQWNSFKWWTQNYIEANQKNFQIRSGSIKRKWNCWRYFNLISIINIKWCFIFIILLWVIIDLVSKYIASIFVNEKFHILWEYSIFITYKKRWNSI